MKCHDLINTLFHWSPTAVGSYCVVRLFSDTYLLWSFGLLDNDKGKLDQKEMIFGIVTRIDLLNFITLGQQGEATSNGEV